MVLCRSRLGVVEDCIGCQCAGLNFSPQILQSPARSSYIALSDLIHQVLAEVQGSVRLTKV